jgi:hypothetical protein
MTGTDSATPREITRVRSAATRAALLPVVDLAGYTANGALWLARAAAHLESAAARARRHAARPAPGQDPGGWAGSQPWPSSASTGKQKSNAGT